MVILRLIFVAAIAIACSEPLLRPGASSPMQASVLAIGDSYTAGSTLKDGQGWFNGLVVQKNFKPAVRIAQSGYTAGDALRAIKNESQTYDYITIMIGVNNQYRNTGTEVFKADLQAMILSVEKNKSLAFKKLLLISIPDYGAIPALGRNAEQIAVDIALYNAVISELAKINKATFVDVTAVSKTVKNKPSLATDEFHFSQEMNNEWLQIIINALGV